MVSIPRNPPDKARFKMLGAIVFFLLFRIAGALDPQRKVGMTFLPDVFVFKPSSIVVRRDAARLGFHSC